MSTEVAPRPYRLDVHPGLIHPFLRMRGRGRAAERALDTAAAALRQLLEPA